LSSDNQYCRLITTQLHVTVTKYRITSNKRPRRLFEQGPQNPGV